MKLSVIRSSAEVFVTLNVCSRAFKVVQSKHRKLNRKNIEIIWTVCKVTVGNFL